MKYFLILVVLHLLSCQRIEDKIDKRVILFDMYGDKYFDSIYIRIFRELTNPKALEYEVRKVKGNFRGFIQTQPEKYWHIDRDTMNIEFIEVFSKFNCWYLYNFEGFTFIEFLDKKERVIIYKGTPNVDNYYIKTIKPMEYKDGWKYIIVDFKGER